VGFPVDWRCSFSDRRLLIPLTLYLFRDLDARRSWNGGGQIAARFRQATVELRLGLWIVELGDIIVGLAGLSMHSSPLSFVERMIPKKSLSALNLGRARSMEDATCYSIDYATFAKLRKLITHDLPIPSCLPVLFCY
jgi:hypothetical protein